MKKIRITYWIITILFVALMLVATIPDLMALPAAKDYMVKLGYPAYLTVFLGVAKLLGIIAILVPGFPRLKEWAYAGLAFDLIGATYSEIASGIPPSGWALMFVWLFLLAASYYYYHKLPKHGVNVLQ